MRENAIGLVSFVIPVKDEEQSLRELYDRIAAEMHVLGRTFEVIFIDDGSIDESWRIIGELATAHPDEVVACRFRKNSGKADALAIGFQAARGEIVFTLDADLQDDPKEISRFLAKLDEGYDLVSGWKRTRHDPWHKVLPSRVFNLLISKVLGVRLHDHNCGFKCYRSEVIKHIPLYGEMHRMIPSLASIHGYKSAEIEVEHHARKFGRSKYGLKRFFRGFMDMQTVYFLKNFRERPLHFFGGQAGFCLMMGGLLLAVAFVPWFSAVASGRLLSIAQVFLFGCPPLLGLGFLAEMIVRGNVVKERQLPVAEVMAPRERLSGEAPIDITDLRKAVSFELPAPGEEVSSFANILIVDDDMVTRRMLRLHLEHAGYLVDEAEDGVHALARVTDETAVVLLDLNMNGHNDGLDCLREIRRHHADVKVVMVSAQEEIETAIQTMRLGAFDYLIKPAKSEQLLKVVRKAIQIRGMAEA